MNQFVTKDGGDRATFDGGMVRDTESGKVRWDLIPNELFDALYKKEKNSDLFNGFRYWQQTGKNPGYVIRALIQTECAGDDQAFFQRVAELMTRGAEKYGEWNWTQGKDKIVLDRFKRSADRHFKQYIIGDRTEDHAAAIYFNINGVMYIENILGE